jgi:voltage-gated potassium channel
MNARAQELERRLGPWLLVAALLTIPAIAIEESSVAQPWDTVGAILNWIVWLAFFGEAVAMLRAVDSQWRWLRDHPLEVVIVVLTPPFLPASLQAARVFRLLRVLRLLRLGILSRRLLSTEGLRDAAILAVVTILGGGTAFAALENGHGSHAPMSAWDGVWWAVTTITTVGYGDLYPVTTGGRIIAIAMMFIGIGFVAILTAAAADRFLRAQREERSELARIESKLDDLIVRLDTDGRSTKQPRA